MKNTDLTGEIKFEGDYLAVEYRRERLFRLGEKQKNYDNYMHSETWKNLCRLLRQKFGNRCQTCNDTGEQWVLHAHHRTYVRFTEEKLEDLTLLCERCHKRVHYQNQIDGQTISIYYRL